MADGSTQMTEEPVEVIQADEPWGCPECGLYSCICFDDDDRTEEDDLLDECGMMPDGYCTLAGTEHCDWDCPRSRP